MKTMEDQMIKPLQRWAGANARPEPGEVLAITVDGWSLHARSAGDRMGWKNFVLVSPPSVVEKRKFWGAHNGARLARNHDLAVLNARHPAIYEWLKQTLGVAGGTEVA
jgi:hypothetical protein